MYTGLTVSLLCILLTSTRAQIQKCDQKPPLATVDEPRENNGVFVLKIANTDPSNGKIYFTPDQTYVLTVKSNDARRAFNWFMITAEDPAVDNSTYDLGKPTADVGTLKTLGSNGKSQYSARCAFSVENIDNSYKNDVEIHWISPKKSKRNDKQQHVVRIRAMVAENREAWYTGGDLTLTMYMDDKPPKDKPPLVEKAVCTLCSEARYEVVFEGKWSRLTHPLHYPSRPDENGYSHMVGASHGTNFTLWQQGTNASPGLKQIAETADPTLLEREIIDAMVKKNGARTLIRGKRRHHPYMSEGSHSLFRVDRDYHMFSLVVAMRPSPDWFLGTSNFELCDDTHWLKEAELPLYPWDAGTMNGVSYESPTRMTQPIGNVERVEVGSFNKESPFYQINFNDLKPFAILKVKRLDVYKWNDESCVEGENVTEDEEAAVELQQDEPLAPESIQNCVGGEWGEWTSCTPLVGGCGVGKQTRTRKENNSPTYREFNTPHRSNKGGVTEKCDSQDAKLIQHQDCYIEC